LEFDSGSAKFDLTIEVIEQDGVLDSSIECSTALFERRTVMGLSHHFETSAGKYRVQPGPPDSGYCYLG
jgi:hypothetical protein